MSKTELKVVEGGEGNEDQESPRQITELTEELPPVKVDPNSFDARIAGIESCSVVRELSKHWSVVAAFELEQEELRGEVK
ncbi:MAG: hypothetical protein M3362_22585, partial [Acidobacteriota bacterium]|nr:hypothetical protein [Acidobacteriota bacterium]